MAPRGYPAEFRRRVIELVDAGRPVAVVAAELGISDQSIYSWRRQARIEEVSDASLSSVLSGGGREVRFS
ncbi:MAG: transposase, partial [Acidimicrobiaceae bacterium]|nr:transposase [Acidimicrobiaceae bacterium]